MTICKQYTHGKERIEITLYDNGRYFIDYGVTYTATGMRYYNSSAGYFCTLETAQAVLQMHRPGAKEI